MKPVRQGGSEEGTWLHRQAENGSGLGQNQAIPQKGRQNFLQLSRSLLAARLLAVVINNFSADVLNLQCAYICCHPRGPIPFLSHVILTNEKESGNIISIIQKGKLKLREVKCLGPGLSVSQMFMAELGLETRSSFTNFTVI